MSDPTSQVQFHEHVSLSHTPAQMPRTITPSCRSIPPLPPTHIHTCTHHLPRVCHTHPCARKIPKNTHTSLPCPSFLSPFDCWLCLSSTCDTHLFILIKYPFSRRRSIVGSCLVDLHSLIPGNSFTRVTQGSPTIGPEDLRVHRRQAHDPLDVTLPITPPAPSESHAEPAHRALGSPRYPHPPEPCSAGTRLPRTASSRRLRRRRRRRRGHGPVPTRVRGRCPPGHSHR